MRLGGVRGERAHGGRGLAGRPRLPSGAGGRPLGEPERFTPPTGSGTRTVFELDEASLAPGAAITADPGSLDLHGAACGESDGPARLLLRDLR
ncbi:hypothetical protein ABZ464_39855 [Streptomyces sp. NPDC005820]|uniref:hypothetical protein n=1 Tax=Streptomyces sp. NPDC005820 TaxID=3157069 RepID=UPI0033D65FAA